MPLSENLLETSDYTGAGYLPLADFGGWRVAMLRYIDELLPDRLEAVQRHDETDEVFVLLAGRCILFLGDGRDGVGAIYAEDMQPLKVYNVKRGAWHTHTLSKDATVLIVENRDTADHNSPHVALNKEQRQQLIRLTDELWA
jgi:hypothetical protein